MSKVRRLTLKTPNESGETVITGHEKCEKWLTYYRKVHPGFEVVSDKMIDEDRLTTLSQGAVESLVKHISR